MVHTPKAYEAQALFDAILDELSDADSFTRDDLLHLDVFGHVSTITRYSYVSRAVRLLVNQGRLHEHGQSQLILPAKETSFLRNKERLEEFYTSVASLVFKHGRQWRSFGVSEILDLWTTDVHLSTSTKRTMVRQMLKTMKKEGQIRQYQEYVFRYTMLED